MNIIDLVNVCIGKIPFVDKIPYAAILVPAVVAIISIIFANSGKKLLNVLKFVVCAGAGYVLGSVTLWGYVGAYLAPHNISNVVLGVIIAIIVAVVGKFAYALVFAGALGYGSYMILTNATVAAFVSSVVELNPDIIATLVKNALWIGIGIGVIALFFRGFLETVLTSVGGGAGFSVGLYATIVAITDALNLGVNGTGIKLNSTTPVFGPLTFETVVLVVIGMVIFLCGFLKQVKNRHRY